MRKNDRKTLPDNREAVFESLYEDYKDAVFRFSLYLCRDRREAEDLFQETWLRIARHLPESSRTPGLKSWIFTIVSNLHKDLLRKKKIRTLFLIRESGTEPSGRETGRTSGLELAPNPMEAPIRSDMRKAILDALSGLPERQRRVFVLKEIAGFRQQEVSSILGLPLGTVKSLMHRAVKNLRKELLDYKPNEVSIKCDVNTLNV